MGHIPCQRCTISVVKPSESHANNGDVLTVLCILTLPRYEAHAGILEAENTSLRDQNISLELRLLDILRQSTTAASSRGRTAVATATNPHLSPSRCHHHRHHAALVSKRVTTAGEKEGNEDSETCPKQHNYGTGVLQQAEASATACGDSGATSRFRVDGRVPQSGSGGEAGKPWPGGGAPMCAAVLKDLRRRLKEAELEAKEMRAERAAVDKRERLVSPGSVSLLFLVLHLVLGRVFNWSGCDGGNGDDGQTPP